jgi:hypothetical protein
MALDPDTAPAVVVLIATVVLVVVSVLFGDAGNTVDHPINSDQPPAVASTEDGGG